MCLIVDRTKHPDKKPKSKVLTKQMITYKVLWSGMMSLYWGFQYQMNEIHTLGRGRLKLDVDEKSSGFDPAPSVSEGFHSYAVKGIALEIVAQSADNVIAVTCVIPKGARVFYGTSDEVVSNKITVTNVIAVSKLS